MLDTEKTKKFIEHLWDSTITPTLMEYIHIPNKSPAFDPEWEANGYMDKAAHLMADWCKQQTLPGMTVDIIRLPKRTPVIFIEIPGDSAETILLYGHLDKQPEMAGWDADLAPWKAVLKGDKLYGRGGADDGYAVFASIAAIKALASQQIPHARCVILIEASEESGSVDLPYYIDALEDKIGKPDLVICLDSGCGNYDQLWMTTSLRGLINGVLQIEVLKQGIHSGMGSGTVPSCFLVLRQLLSRIEDETNGMVRLPELQVKIPAQRLQQAELAADILKNTLKEGFPFADGTQAVSDNMTDLILNRTWRSALSIIGAEGLPLLKHAGNVTLPSLTLKLSMRIPPNCDATVASLALKNALEKNPPFGANVQFDTEDNSGGWDAPIESPWLTAAANKASMTYFGKGAAYLGEGGSIPFMGMLGKKFPKAQFLITGVLGPHSNAHGPNEFLNLTMGKKLTCCVAEIIADQFAKQRAQREHK